MLADLYLTSLKTCSCSCPALASDEVSTALASLSAKVRKAWLEGWIFGYMGIVFVSIAPCSHRPHRHTSWNVPAIERQLLTATLQLGGDGHFQEFPLVFCHAQTRAACAVLPNLWPSTMCSSVLPFQHVQTHAVCESSQFTPFLICTSVPLCSSYRNRLLCCTFLLFFLLFIF